MSEPELVVAQSIGDLVHPTMPERFEVLREKYELFPAGCYGLKVDYKTVGYGIAHPWLTKAIPTVDAFLGRLPDSPNCIHVHDVGILPEARGRDASGAYMGIMRGLARRMGLRYLTLVSVYGTDALWSRYGFEVVPVRAMDSYGSTAKYMACDLDR